MSRLLYALALGALLAGAPPAPAQAAPKDDVKRLEAELDELLRKVEAVEAKLKAAKAAAAKKDDRRPGFPGRGRFGPGAGGRFDPDKMKEMAERFRKMREEDAKKDKEEAKKSDPRSRGGRTARPATPADAKTADLEKRLDRVLKEIEEIRRELKKR